MKRLLLDTHVLIWAVANPDRLNKRVRSIIENPDNQIYISSISVVEIEIKRNLGKIDLSVEYEEILQSLDADWLSLSAKQAAHLRQLPDIHRDPFDRLLISQTIVENMTLVSADQHIQKYPVSLLKAV